MTAVNFIFGSRIRRHRILLGLADLSRIVAFPAYCDRVGTDRNCSAVSISYIALFFTVIQNLIIPACLENFSVQFYHRGGRIGPAVICLTLQSL